MLPIPIVFGFFVIFFLWTFDKLARPKGFPPGPFLFPIVGIFPHCIRKSFLEKAKEWKQTYGNITGLSLGSNRAVLLHDLDVIKEAFSMEEFTGRPLLAPFREIATENRRGLVFSVGAQWEAQRRFALRHLRDFGFGKRSIETATFEDVVDLNGKFKKELGQPISIANRFNMSVVNCLWHIIAGQRYDIDDPEFQNILHTLNAAIATSNGNSPALSMDWVIKLAPELTGWNKFKTAIMESKEFVKKQIESHKATFQPGHFRDFMDVYINEMKATTNVNSSFYTTAGDENLLVGVINLLGAGAETTSVTLTWGILYLTRNPSIQIKLQAEIDRVIGSSRLPSLADQKAMPYACATILEILRKSSLIPLNVPHCTMTDVQFHGFTIPKNTIILTNLYDIHHNPKIWGDPEVFRPERFLTSDGKLNKKHSPIVPFSIGRRQCSGETLARNNIFLFLVSLFQAFNIKEHPRSFEGNDSKEPNMGLFRLPPEFKVVFEERTQIEIN